MEEIKENEVQKVVENKEVEVEKKETSLDEVIGSFDADSILNHPSLKKALQSRVDSTVTKALTTARSKWEEEKDLELDEAKRLEKMTAEQREKYQFKKEKEAFETERKKFEFEQLGLSAGKELMKRGIDASMSQYVTGKTAEDTMANIDKFELMFNQAVSNAVNSKMKGNAPKDVTKKDTLTLDAIKDMSTEEINANWEEVQAILKA